MRRGWLLLLAVAALVSGCGPDAPDPHVLRVGHFPNVTHAQALIGHRSTDAGRGWFEARLPAGTRVEWYVYNAGPSAMEALWSGAIDLAYVGPNPALNAHIKSRGEEVRVVAGAARGGGGLVVPRASASTRPTDFRGKRIATPQFGNTQDVACRSWLTRGGLRVTQSGGDVMVVPTPNPEQLSLFQQGRLAGVWTVEPWVSRLELEADGKLLVEEPAALTTILVASARSLRERAPLVRAFATAHAELTTWLITHPAEAKEEVAAEILRLTRVTLPGPVLDRSWARLRFQVDLSLADFTTLVDQAQQAGFLADAIALDRFLALR